MSNKKNQLQNNQNEIENQSVYCMNFEWWKPLQNPIIVTKP